MSHVSIGCGSNDPFVTFPSIMWNQRLLKSLFVCLFTVFCLFHSDTLSPPLPCSFFCPFLFHPSSPLPSSSCLLLSFTIHLISYTFPLSLPPSSSSSAHLLSLAKPPVDAVTLRLLTCLRGTCRYARLNQARPTGENFPCHRAKPCKGGASYGFVFPSSLNEETLRRNYWKGEREDVERV